FEQASGQYLISGCVGAGATNTIILMNCGTLTVLALEDVSASMFLRRGSGANTLQAVFIGCTWQGQVPAGANDEVVVYSGALTFIGCHLQNQRVYGTTIPRIVVINMRSSNTPGSLSLLNCHVENTTAASGFIFDGRYPGGTDVVADGTGKLTMLSCTGGSSGAIVSLPTIVPPVSRWQASSGP